MPSFSPKIESSGIPNFDVGGGEALSTLFRGLGDTIGGIAKTADDAIQNRIQRDAQSVFEEANKPFTDMADVPGDVQNAQESFSRLRDAKEQGKLSDTAYYAKLVSETKRLKAQYPGYGDVVDAAIQTATGTRPANALRNAILAQIDSEEAAAQKQEKDWIDFIENKGNQEAIGAQYPDLFTNPERYASPEARAEVKSAALVYNGKMGEMDMVKNKLAVDKDTYEANKMNIGQKTNGYIAFKVAEDITGLNRMMENQYGTNLYNTLSNISTGKLKLDPMEQQQFIGQIKLKRDALYNRLMLEVNSRTNGFMPPDDVKKLLDSSMAPYDNILSSLQEGKWDIAGAHSRAIRNMQDRDMYDLLKNNKQLRLFDSIEKVSPALAQRVLTEPGGAKVAVTLGEILASNLNGEDATSLADELSNVAGSSKINSAEKAEGMKYSLDLVTTQLADPNGDPESFKKVFNRVYDGNNVFKSVGDRSQLDVFTKLTDPSITDKIVKSGDKELLQKYYNWSISQFQSLSDFRRMASDVNSVQETSNFMTAQVGDNGKLELFINAEEFNAWANSTAGLNKTVMVRTMRNTINNFEKFNTAFSGVVPIMEAVGADVPSEMSRILANTGVNLDAREDSWMMWISEAITGENVPDRDEVDQLTPFKEFLAKNPEWLKTSMNYEQVGAAYKSAVAQDNKSGQMISNGKGLENLVSSSKRGYSPDLKNLRPEIVKGVEELQAAWGRPIPIVSGYRDPARNKKAGGAKKSQHMHGNAVDIDVSNLSIEERKSLIRKASELGFTGIGVYTNSLHLDKGNKRFWGPNYKGSSLPKWARDVINEHMSR